MIQLEALRQAVVRHRTDYLYVLEVVNTFLKELTKCVVRARVWVLSQSRVCLLIWGYILSFIFYGAIAITICLCLR